MQLCGTCTLLIDASSDNCTCQLKQFNYTDIHRVVSRIPGVYVQEEDGLGLRKLRIYQTHDEI